LFLFATLSAVSATYYTRGSGNWATASVWSTASCGGAAAATAPTAGDIVFICNGHTVTVAATASCTTLNVSTGGVLTFNGNNILTVSGSSTIDGTVTTVNTGGSAATSTLQCNGNVTINSGGAITNNGQFNMANSTVFTINNGGTYTHNPENNDAANATMFNRTGATNTFGASSNLIMSAWHTASVPLGQYASQFGNITFSAGLVWDQDGTFSPNKIKGNVLSTNGQINFDDGTGATTVLTINGSVTTSGTAGMIFAGGANRNLTLTTGAVTHNGSSLMSCMYQTHGNLIWNINGTATFNKDFTAIQGSATPASSSSSITITGDFNIGGTSLFDINRGLTGTTSPVTVSVGGASTWSSSGWIRFLDGGNGAVSFTTNSIASSGTGKVRIKMGANTTAISGNVTINCTNNFAISGGNDFKMLGGDALGTLGSNVTTGDGTNDCILTVGGVFSMNSSASNVFMGIDVTGTSSVGVFTGNFGSIDFNGGTIYFHNGNHTAGGLNTINVTGNFSMNFTNSTDIVICINNISSGAGPTYNNIRQNITVGGNLSLSGNTTAASFRGSAATGVQNVNIAGNFNIGGGSGSRFTSGSLGHALTVNVSGNLNVTAGELWYSYRPGTVTSLVTGNMAVSGGSLAIKGDIGASTHTVNGNYTQTGGYFSLYHDDAKAIDMTDVIAMTINGTFSETAGVLSYDNRSASTGTHLITLYGSSFTFGGTGIINRGAASPFTSITSAISTFGEFYFARAGTTTYNNSAAPATTHFIQGVKQFINSGTTVDASASTNEFLIASNSTQNNIAGTNAKWALNVNGILDMGAGKISSFPAITAYYSGIRVNSAARLRTSNTAGFYDGTTSACLQPQVFNGNTNYRMDFNLDATSTVEYYAAANQVVTGKYPIAGAPGSAGDVALATTAQYHYGYLDINNQGTLGTNYAYPAVPGSGTGNVFVRTSLLLTRGELNLAGSGTGQTINIENPASTGITRDGVTTTGYIKSEEQNSGNNRAKVMWYMGTNTGAHIYPFGYTTGANNYVPFTFNKTTAGSSDIAVSTRATASSNNTPWAAVSNVAAVANMASAMGNYPDASTPSVIDRWWDITSSAAVTANCTFSYRGAENTTTVNPTGNFGAQHWNGTGWDAAVGTGVGVTSGVGSVTANGLSTFSPWILASLNAVLPIELAKFTIGCENENTIMNWSTASETNNDYFTIDKSYDGIRFFEIAKVYSKANRGGNSTSFLNYSFIDYGTSDAYYKLSQTDIDGKYEVLKTVHNTSCNEKKSSLDAFAFDKNITLHVNALNDVKYSVTVLNSLGQNVLVGEFSFTKGFSEQKLDCDFLSNGVYYISITDGATQLLSKKIILSK